MKAQRLLIALILFQAVWWTGCGEPPRPESEEPMEPEITEQHPVSSDLSTDNEVVAEPEADEAPPEPTTVWSYTGESGPSNWAALDETFSKCGDGVVQSPVDLVIAEASAKAGDKKKATAKTPELPKVTFDHEPFPVALALIDHLVRLPVLDGAGGGIDIDGTAYTLIEIHFHTPGEHRVDGKGYPLEAHLVHRNEDGDLAVLGVFGERGADGEENEALEPLFANLPDSPTSRALDGETISAADFLPTKTSAFQYGGSLTTPPCSENVRWFVLEEPVAFSPSQLERLRELTPDSNRPIQPLGDRTITRGELG